MIEMAPDFAPNHVANVKALSREGYFVNGAVTRVQDNYVAQWSQGIDPPRPPKVGKATLTGEFTRPRDPSVPFTVLPDPDTYAPEVGFSNGFAAARDDTSMWLTHCYGRSASAGTMTTIPAAARSSMRSSGRARACSTATSPCWVAWCRAWSFCPPCPEGRATSASTRRRKRMCTTPTSRSPPMCPPTSAPILK